ncbi:MAG: Flp pilus assembly complex ATPase component TadA, partial [Burkholderiales bacterium]|nr:Flp pilus assembly complex ATPase component TadA [Burkholderiales bacterium]
MNDYQSLFTGSPGLPVETGSQSYRILLVDDELNVLRALQRIFRRENYRISTASNGNEALDLLSTEDFHLMISDYLMPGMNGAELLRRAKEIQPEMIRIMLTGHADTNAVMGAINEGAVYKFILKPWNDDDLRITVALALEQYDLIRKNRELKKENEKKSKEITALSRIAVSNRSQLAIMLSKKNLLSPVQVQELHRLQQQKKEPIIHLLLEKGWVGEKDIRRILKDEFLFEEVSLSEFAIDRAISELIPRSFCERQLVVPLRMEGRRIMLAVADPLDTGLIDDLRFVSGLDVQVVMASVSEIREKLAELYGQSGSVSFEDMETLVSETDPYEGVEVVIEDEDDASLEELLRGTEAPPAIRLVNAVILEGVRLGASDIHIQPRTKSVAVRYRIDGVLLDKIQIPNSLLPTIVSRIKIMSELDIGERRRPQDGRITVKTPLRIVDFRISTLPTINGEKVVMRLLDRNAVIRDISEFGFSESDFFKVKRMVSKPQGIVLATGPTGSGKTTTLYGLMQYNATLEKNYITIEDPVEYYLDIAGQVLIKEKIGLNFPTVLRAILRQDPDVILIGEIRDFETAEVAFHAALTGHMVYSTLHTNSALATLARLFDLGMKPYVVASALEGIIAQRLVRKICTHCREEIVPSPEIVEFFEPDFSRAGIRAYRGAGCHHCNQTGYKGRLGIYEVLSMNRRLRYLISSGASMLETEEEA